MKIIFDTFGNDKQKECCKAWIDNSIRDIVYGGSKGSAKSYTGVSLIFGDAFLYPETHYFIAREALNDLRKFTIPSIHEVLNNWGISKDYYSYNGMDNYFSLANGSKVFLLEAKYYPSDPMFERFGSMQNTRGMLEEAGQMCEDAKNNLAASVGRWKNNEYGINGKILQTCNPSKNYLYRSYYKPFKAGTLPSDVKFIQALPNDNKKLQAGYLENLNRFLSPNQKQRLLFGNWEYDDDPTTLCDYENILAIFTNSQIQRGKKYLTCDIARLGSDKAIILVWEGWVVIEKYVYDISRMDVIQSCITSMRQKHNIPARNCIADEDGVGGGVIDNCHILGFVNNSRPLPNVITGDKENYFNLQSQCGYYLAKVINENSIFVQCELDPKEKEELIEDIEQLKSYNEDKDAPLKILPKEKIKANIGRSPDWRDVLLMRSYFDYKPTGKYNLM